MTEEAKNPARDLRSALELLRSPGATQGEPGAVMLDALGAAGMLVLEGDIATLDATLHHLRDALDAQNESWRDELVQLLDAECARFAEAVAGIQPAALGAEASAALLARREELEALAAAGDALGIDVDAARTVLQGTDERLLDLPG